MFTRPEHTYQISSCIVKNIFKDEASPLLRISKIVKDNSKILDIGSGSGLLSDVLKKIHKNIVIDAIDPNPFAEKIAKEKYRKYYCGFFQEIKDEIIKEKYDYIILSDVIEHTENPFIFLNKLLEGLKANIIITVPNISFGAVRLSLLNGEFQYVDSGILEKTHLRFFNFKTLLELIEKLGINIKKQFFLRRNIFKTEIVISHKNVSLQNFIKLRNDRLASVYQFLFELTFEKVDKEVKSFGNARYPILQFLRKKYFSSK